MFMLHKMADERAKDDFNYILSNINRKFEVQFTKWEADSKIFEAKLKTQIPQDNEDFNALCDEWVDKFSEITDTIWAKKTSNTGPKIRFRKQYQCWNGDGKVVKKELLFDRTRCKGSLDLKVLSDNPLCKRRNKHLKQGLNLTVKVSFHHLHPVDTNQPFAFFVHHCLPQPSPPLLQVQPNSRLEQLVAAMVQNGPEVSRKAAEKAEKIMAKLNEATNASTEPLSKSNHQIIVNYEENIHKQNITESEIQQQQPPVSVEVIGSTTLESVESIKLETYLNDQQYTQFVVNTPQFDFTDQVFMYQPFVLDVPQFISFTAPSVPHQILHIQAKCENHNGQIL